MHHSSLALLLLLAARGATAYFESSEEEIVPWELQVCSQMYTNLEQADSRCVNACMAKRQCKAGYCKIKNGLTRCKCGLCPEWNYRPFKDPKYHPMDYTNNGPMYNVNDMNIPSQNVMY